jgi:hypothetical protein
MVFKLVLPSVDLRIKKDGAACRPASLTFAAAPWRAAAFVSAIGMASLLSACGGGGGSGSGGSASVSSYTLGGTLSGLAEGQTIDLTNGSETMTRSANGAFTFPTPVAQGGNYEVKVSGAQPAWQTCSASNAAGSAVNANVTTVVVNCVSADMVATGLLNDTGIDWCSENITTPSKWVNNAVCSAVNWVGNLWGQQQDAFFGRDAQAKAGTLTKVGGGMAGFDFTKLGASGKVLVKQDATWSDTGTEAAGTQWDCVRDNVTGLVWEVKRNDANHLRHMGHGYAWYNPSATTNGGSAGHETPTKNTNPSSFGDPSATTVKGPTCTGVADVNKCNTQSYITAVNSAGLCGKKDWRMPTVEELHSLLNMGTWPRVDDTNYFPNTNSWYWSSSPYAFVNPDSLYIADYAWHISGGGVYADVKFIAGGVRLVRSAQ